MGPWSRHPLPAQEAHVAPSAWPRPTPHACRCESCDSLEDLKQMMRDELSGLTAKAKAKARARALAKAKRNGREGAAGRSSDAAPRSTEAQRAARPPIVVD